MYINLVERFKKSLQFQNWWWPQFYQSWLENPPGGGRLNLLKLGTAVTTSGGGISKPPLDPSCSPVSGLIGNGFLLLVFVGAGAALTLLLLTINLGASGPNKAS